MPRTDAAYQRIATVDGQLAILDDGIEPSPDAIDIAMLQVRATLAVAQATMELHGELDGIRTMIGNLR